MKAAELEQAAATVRASQHPAATQIADLLEHAARALAIRENAWTACEYSPTIQHDLTQAHFGREIAIARALTGEQVAT
jgi:hypothetical protein